MKLQFIFLFVCCVGVYAENLHSQDVRVSIVSQNISIKEVLHEIEEKTDYLFLYNKEDVDLNRKTSLNIKDTKVSDLLTYLFNGTNVKYVLVGNNVVLMKEDLFQQDKMQVTGTIIDENGESIIGANIVEKGTTNGVVTDVNGKYSINIPNKETVLVFTFIGYATQEVVIGDQREVNVTLKIDIRKIEEVVVIGYGTIRKKDLTGSVVQIRPDKLENESPKTVQDLLRGTPGLQVGYDASAKGGGTMMLRGQRSVYTDGGHNNPLLILDGMQFYGELSEINPDDIAQIDILKDASAAAIYGAKAASGVIIITTKKGKQGKPVVNVTANIGWTQQSDYRKRFSPEEYLQHRQDWLEKRTYGENPATGAWEAYTGIYANRPDYFKRPDQLPSVSLDTWRGYTANSNESGESDLSIWAKRLELGGNGNNGNVLKNFLAGKFVDWGKITYRTGFNQDYNVSVSGAGEKIDYYLSMGYLKNQGALINDDYQSIRSNMKINTKVNSWFEVGANVNFQNRSDGSIGMDTDFQLSSSPYGDYKDAEGNLVQYPLDGNYSQRGYNYEFQRQYLDLERGYTVLNTILNAKISLPFNITYSFNASPRYQYLYDRYFMSADLPGSSPKSRGVNREQAKSFDWSLNNTINWDYTFAQKHHIILTIVQEAEERRYWKDRIDARNMQPSDALGFHNTKSSTKEDSNYSSEDTHQTADALLARLFYSYDSRYMLTASIRRDGYSAFGSSNPYAFFPSIAVAWSFTNEKFFTWNDVMSAGKLRASFGKNGNRSLSNPYLALANLSEGKMQGYINSSGEFELYRYLMANRMANPTLQWEKTKSWNFALDFGFLNDRISGSIEYYNMSTHDMIMNKRLPEFTGFPSITTNLGQVENRGIELSLSTLNIKNDNLKWTTSFGFSYNQNKIKHLYYEYEDIVDAGENVTGSRERDDETNNWFIGQPINAIWNYRVTGIWQKDEWKEAKRYGQVPGDPKVANNYTADDVVNADGTVTPVYNNKDKEFLGETSPPFHWSLRNEFVLWKDLSISFNIYSYMGHKSLATYYLNFDDEGGRMTYALQNVTKKEYWTINNPTNKYGRIEAQGPTGASSPGKLYNRSFIRLDNISVGYTLPKQWTSRLDLAHIKVYGTIRNVAVWGKDWEYGDPETSPSFTSGGGLATRIYTLGLNFTF